MNSLQKRFVSFTIFVFVVSAFFAFMLKQRGDIYLQPIFYHLFIRYDLPAALLGLGIIMTSVLFAPKIPERYTDAIFQFFADKSKTIAFIFLLVACFGSVVIYHNHPLCMDEYMPHFQAKVFAAGKLWGQYPPELMDWLVIPDFFSVFSAETGRVVSCYWPGFALLLTPFMKIGMPWLLNPLLGVGTILLLYYYCSKVFAESQAASWVVLFTVASPVFIINSISYYSMPAHMFLNLLFAVLLLELSAWRMFLAGVVGSLALVLHNPVPHFLFALPWVVWIATKPCRFKQLAYLMMGYLPLSVTLGFGWVFLQELIASGVGGNALHAVKDAEAVSAAIVPQYSLSAMSILRGFLIDKPLQMIKAVFVFPDTNIVLGRFIATLKLFVWAVPGLPILAYLGLRNNSTNPHLKLWIWSAVGTFVGYLFVPMDQGHGWGYRYFYSAWLALPLLAASFLASSPSNRNSWRKVVCVISLLSMFVGTVLRFYQVNQFITEHLDQLPPIVENKRQICFIDYQASGYYTKDLIQNDPFLRDPVEFLVRHEEEENMAMLEEIFPSAVKTASRGLNSVWEISEQDFGRLKFQ